MSFRQKKEKFYLTLGTLSTLSVFISRPRIVIFNKVSSAFRYVCVFTLFNILINQKAGHLGKRKTDNSAGERTRKLHTSEYTNSPAKKEKFSLFQ